MNVDKAAALDRKPGYTWGMRHVDYQVRIDAPPVLVWQILTDLANYPAWNQYASQAQGQLQVGGNVEIVAKLGRSAQRVNNRVLVLEPPNRLCWESLNWYHALVYGVRCRTLTPQPDGKTLFREEEAMYGPLAGLVHGLLRRQLLNGLRMECESLKVEAERRARKAS